MISYFLCFLLLGFVSAGPLQGPDITFDVDESVLKQLKIDIAEAQKFTDDGDNTVITAIINRYADKLLNNIDHYMAKQKFDPMAMPDIPENFHRFSIFSGEFTLNEGVMTGASTLHRDGNCVVTYNKSSEIVEVDMPLAFSDLKFKYNYRVKVLKIEPTGYTDGKLTELRLRVRISADLNTYLMKLDNYEVANSGEISVKLYGNLIYDWLLNMMTSITTTTMKPVILTLVEVIIKGTLKQVITTINTLVQEFLRPDSLTNLLIESSFM